MNTEEIISIINKDKKAADLIYKVLKIGGYIKKAFKKFQPVIAKYPIDLDKSPINDFPVKNMVFFVEIKDGRTFVTDSPFLLNKERFYIVKDVRPLTMYERNKCREYFKATCLEQLFNRESHNTNISIISDASFSEFPIYFNNED
jgi:hypothetical protein